MKIILVLPTLLALLPSSSMVVAAGGLRPPRDPGTKPTESKHHSDATSSVEKGTTRSRMMQSCTDSPPGWVDSFGDGCSFYKLNQHFCGFAEHFASNGLTANTVCCVCNDGTFAQPPPPEPQPAPAPVPQPIPQPVPAPAPPDPQPNSQPAPDPVPSDPSSGSAIPLKVKNDTFGVGDRLKAALSPFLPVEFVNDASSADLNLALTSGPFNQNGFSEVPQGDYCAVGGYTLTGQIDPNHENFEDQVRIIISWTLQDLGVQQQAECTNGYLYNFKREISCCTAKQLTTIDTTCYKGTQEANPSCWTPPDTAPTPGTPIVKVKFLLSPNIAGSWTQADTEKELEQTNFLLASSEGLAPIRFQFHSQQVGPTDWGTSTTTNHDEARKFADTDPSRNDYDLIVYLYNNNPGLSQGKVGLADILLCGGFGPSVTVVNTHGIKQFGANTFQHELVHPLGADHSGTPCTDYIEGGGLELGMSSCNIGIMNEAIPTYTCLEPFVTAS